MKLVTTVSGAQKIAHREQTKLFLPYDQINPPVSKGDLLYIREPWFKCGIYSVVRRKNPGILRGEKLQSGKTMPSHIISLVVRVQWIKYVIIQNALKDRWPEYGLDEKPLFEKRDMIRNIIYPYNKPRLNYYRAWTVAFELVQA